MDVIKVVVRDREGFEHRGLVRVGNAYWFCTSANRCPVEARWGAGVEPLRVMNTAADSLRARVEGSALAGRITTRRLVLVFAITDLVLACLVLAFEVMMLGGVAIGIDRLSGNSPSPDTRQGDLFGTAAFFGMFALYLPALVTLSAGGVGLIRLQALGILLPPGWGHLRCGLGLCDRLYDPRGVCCDSAGVQDLLPR